MLGLVGIICRRPGHAGAQARGPSSQHPGNTPLRQYILCTIVCIVKTRVTITLDPKVIRKAKAVARLRHTNLSSLIEDLLIQTTRRGTRSHAGFAKRWTGRFDLRHSEGDDALLDALKQRYGLDDK